LGETILQNKSLALHYCELSADQGCVEMESVYGEYLLSGIGIEVNVEVSIEYARRAVDHGLLSAQLRCATLFRQKLHIERNLSLSGDYFKCQPIKARLKLRLKLQGSLFEMMLSQKMSEKARNIYDLQLIKEM
jgi:TPR repeat protein